MCSFINSVPKESLSNSQLTYENHRILDTELHLNVKYFIGRKARKKYFIVYFLCRMIPIAISSSEADYIRQLLRSQRRKKNVGNKEKDHLRHPRKIKKNDSKVSDEGLKSLEYQVIYKSSSNESPLSEEKTTTDKSKTTPAPNSEVNTTRISVKPRGPPTGFFNRDKFKQILTSNLRTDRDQSKGENWSKDHNFK